jgi:hypothetical protein
MISVGIVVTSRETQHIVDDSDLMADAFERGDQVVASQRLALGKPDQEIPGILEHGEQLQCLLEAQPEARGHIAHGSS